jgi:hypothetical protein
MNGLTLQLAGEALLCREEDEPSFYDFRWTYLACLEDFVFGALFSDAILVSGAMPRRGSSSPGLTLKERSGSFIVAAETGSTASPESCLRDRECRERVLGKIRLMEKNFDSESERYFVDWIIREALADLGNHESLCDHAIPLDDIKFQKSPAPMIDRELQNAVPELVSDTLLTYLIQAFFNHPTRPSLRALREFITRNIITHIVIDVWYDLIFSQREKTKFLPYVTRRYFAHSYEQRLKELVMPYAMAGVAKQVSERKGFITALKQVREWSLCAKIREYLDDFYFGGAAEQERLLSLLTDAIMDATSRFSSWQTKLSADKEDWRLKFLPHHHLLTEINAESLKVRDSLSTLFPHLVASVKQYEAGVKPMITQITTGDNARIYDGSTHNETIGSVTYVSSANLFAEIERFADSGLRKVVTPEEGEMLNGLKRSAAKGDASSVQNLLKSSKDFLLRLSEGAASELVKQWIDGRLTLT